MKRIIDGVRYDTATAQEIYAWDAGWDVRGMCAERAKFETLYRTPEGLHFLEGGGGELSSWSIEISANARKVIGGCGIIPLSDNEAELWLVELGDLAIRALVDYLLKPASFKNERVDEYINKIYFNEE